MNEALPDARNVMVLVGAGFRGGISDDMVVRISGRFPPVCSAADCSPVARHLETESLGPIWLGVSR